MTWHPSPLILGFNNFEHIKYLVLLRKECLCRIFLDDFSSFYYCSRAHTSTWGTSSSCRPCCSASLQACFFILSFPATNNGTEAPIPIPMEAPHPTELERPAPRPIKSPKPATNNPIPPALNFLSAETMIDDESELFCTSHLRIVFDSAVSIFMRDFDSPRILSNL